MARKASDKPWLHNASGWWCATLNGKRKKLDKNFVAAFHAALRAPMTHQFQVGSVVLIAEKSRLPTVPALGNMMRNAGNYHSRQSCHAANLAIPPRIVKSYVWCHRNAVTGMPPARIGQVCRVNGQPYRNCKVEGAAGHTADFLSIHHRDFDPARPRPSPARIINADHHGGMESKQREGISPTPCRSSGGTSRHRGQFRQSACLIRRTVE
jgi:hypothetical protein